MTASATLTNGIVNITTGQWSDKFHVDKLDYWIAFYREMFKQHKRQSYQAVMDALISVKED